MALKRFPAELEYKRNPKLTKDDVEAILKYAEESEELPNISEEDGILFVTSCDYDLNYAKKVLSLNYKFKAENPQFFYDRDPLDESLGFDKTFGFFFVLPGLTHDGCNSIYLKLLDLDVSNFNHERETNLGLLHHELMVYEVGATAGWRAICDMEGMSMGMITKLQPSLFKKVFYYFQETCPVKLRGIHIVHPTPIVRILMAMLKPFLSAAVANNLHIHNSEADLYKFVSKSLLPSNVGGDLESAHDLKPYVKKRLIDNREILLKNKVPPKVEPTFKRGGFWRSARN